MLVKNEVPAPHEAPVRPPHPECIQRHSLAAGLPLTGGRLCFGSDGGGLCFSGGLCSSTARHESAVISCHGALSTLWRRHRRLNGELITVAWRSLDGVWIRVGRGVRSGREGELHQSGNPRNRTSLTNEDNGLHRSLFASERTVWVGGSVNVRVRLTFGVTPMTRAGADGQKPEIRAWSAPAVLASRRREGFAAIAAPRLRQQAVLMPRPPSVRITETSSDPRFVANGRA